jgi:hypothetical protein
MKSKRFAQPVSILRRDRALSRSLNTRHLESPVTYQVRVPEATEAVTHYGMSPHA